jgi:hypothetical protein
MAYKEYNYGPYRREIKELMRKRLRLLDKVKYYELKVDEIKERINNTQQQIEEMLKLADGKM